MTRLYLLFLAESLNVFVVKILIFNDNKLIEMSTCNYLFLLNTAVKGEG